MLSDSVVSSLARPDRGLHDSTEVRPYRTVGGVLLNWDSEQTGSDASYQRDRAETRSCRVDETLVVAGDTTDSRNQLPCDVSCSAQSTSTCVMLETDVCMRIHSVRYTTDDVYRIRYSIGQAHSRPVLISRVFTARLPVPTRGGVPLAEWLSSVSHFGSLQQCKEMNQLS